MKRPILPKKPEIRIVTERYYIKEKKKNKLPPEWKVKCLMFFSDVFYFLNSILFNKFKKKN